jgi:hypothetical protein
MENTLVRLVSFSVAFFNLASNGFVKNTGVFLSPFSG